jgi:TRAP-type uncharacterized transport system substrate-binding protein
MRRLIAALSLFAFLADANSAFSTDRFFGLLVGESAWLADAETISANTDFENKMRVVPLIGTGAVQALQDIKSLQNIDAAIITADSLLYAQRQNVFNTKIETTTEVGRLNLVLLVKPEITNLTKLAGKRIATGPAQSAGFASGELIFSTLEIPFLRVPMQGANALKAMQDGSADAALVQLDDEHLQNIKFKILPLPVPSKLADTYGSKIISVQGKKLETLTVALQLITLHTNQNANVKAFQALLSQAIPPTIIPTGGKP